MATAELDTSDIESNATVASRVAARTLTVFCRQSIRIPFGVSVLCSFAVYILWDAAPREHLVAWASVTWLALLFRAALGKLLINRTLDNAQVLLWTRVMIGICAFNGLSGGAAGLLFFAEASTAERALLTMLLCGWCAGAMSTSGSMPRAFYVFLPLFLLPITYSWMTSGGHEGIVIGALLIFFALYQITFVRDNARMVAQSLMLGYTNELLAEQLELKNREAQSARERAEAANRSKSEFMAAASHDLRQPMNALSISATVLRLAAPDAKTRTLAENIESSARALDGLFSGLLDISQIDAGRIQPQWTACTLDAVLDQVYRDFSAAAEAKGIEFNVEKHSMVVRTDPVLLKRIVSNLVSNAIRYTSHGRVSVRASAHEGTLALEVVDSGIGIPPEEQNKIFHEFYQVNNPGRDREQGIGLGLAIVHRLSGLLDCTVEVHSEVGRGSTFRVKLPWSSESAAQVSLEKDLEHTPPPVDLTGLVVLVIDDDQAVQVAMRELLYCWGCAPIIATGHDDALIHAREYPGDVGLIIADYRLAHGENGILAVKRLREHLGKVPALLVTGETAPDRLADAAESGFPVLYKPILAERLRLQIEAVCGFREEGNNNTYQGDANALVEQGH